MDLPALQARQPQNNRDNKWQVRICTSPLSTLLNSIKERKKRNIHGVLSSNNPKRQRHIVARHSLPNAPSSFFESTKTRIFSKILNHSTRSFVPRSNCISIHDSSADFKISDMTACKLHVKFARTYSQMHISNASLYNSRHSLNDSSPQVSPT